MALPVDSGGCGWYRIRQPMAMIRKHTEADTHLIDTQGDDMLEVTKGFQYSDVAVVRQGGEAAIKEIGKDFPHLKWVLDIDDNIETISPYSEHYSEYGMANFTDPDSGIDLWKDGEKGFSIARNRLRVEKLLQGMRDADLITVTTEKLGEYAKQYNPHVAVLPNLIDTGAWWKLPLRPNKRIRLGWAGGVSHYEDLYSVKDALNAFLKRGDTELVMVGAHFPGLIDEKYRDRVEVHPWTAFQAHSYRLMCLSLDIAIVPLTDLPFNHYKSSIKLLEFSAMGVPTVVAGVTPYKEELQKGLPAFHYTTPRQAQDLLFGLCDNPNREKLGIEAREYILKHHDAAKLAHLWPDAYRSILS